MTTETIKALELESPWERYRKYLFALFELDPDIEVGEVEETGAPDAQYRVTVTAKTATKLIALRHLLPEAMEYGRVTLAVRVCDAAGDDTDLPVYDALFEGNRIVKDTRTIIRPGDARWGYVRFQPDVIQFPDDNLADYSGLWSGLPATVAGEVFPGSPGVYFCTADQRENAAPPEAAP